MASLTQTSKTLGLTEEQGETLFDILQAVEEHLIEPMEGAMAPAELNAWPTPDRTKPLVSHDPRPRQNSTGCSVGTNSTNTC